MTTPSLESTQTLTSRWLTRVASWLWQWLRRPWLAITAGIIGVILTLAVWQLPQLPGQLVDEQAAAATWLLNTSTAYGIWGNLFLALGLFDVLRSPLLYLLLALLVPTLAAQLADQLGALRQYQEVSSQPLEVPVQSPGEPLAIPPLRPLFRWRGIINAPVESAVQAVAGRLQQDFTAVKEAHAPIAPPATDSPSEPPSEAHELQTASEARLLATRFPRLHLVRPLLMIGLMVSVTGAWIALAIGWQVTVPPLAPGDAFRSANRNLVLNYTVAPDSPQETALEINIQGTRATLFPAETARQQVGQATVQVRPAYPAVWIVTGDGSDLLALPGERQLHASVGLVFADPGSEESLLIPAHSAGLRIVQRPGSDAFVLELYRSDAIEPVYRAELTQGGQISIPFGPGETELHVYTLPGLQIYVRHLPGLWLVPLGILLALVGAAAFMRPSNFVLAQIAPWSEANTVVVLQSDHPAVVEDLREALAALAPPPAADDTAPAPDAPSPLPQSTE